MNNHSFKYFAKLQGLALEDNSNGHHIRFHQIFGEGIYFLREGSTYFIYQQSGVTWVNDKFPIEKEMFASVQGGNHLHTDNNAFVVLAEKPEYNGVFAAGGPIETKGRLKYIDGCTDSLLIPPVKYGDPCLNHLHFPERIDQTMHTHPSIRLGIVTRGRGECITPFGNIPLETGMVFAILPEPKESIMALGLDGKEYRVGSHKFRTTDSTMDVIAFHPDSDFGPRDEEHPMINRTIVDGVSAKNIDEIKTK